MKKPVLTLFIAVVAATLLHAGSEPIRANKGMVVSSRQSASDIGAQVLRDGGNAVDAAVATAFALAVVHPYAGNIGGGGFLVLRTASGEASAYDFRETAPAGSSATMFLKDGQYDAATHHNSYRSVGVPGTVAGLYMAWKDHGRLPWKRLVEPAVKLARDGFPLSIALAQSLVGVLPAMKAYPASLAQFTKNGAPYEAGKVLRQSDLARTLQRIAAEGRAGFYEGETALLIDKEMKAHGGLITRDDLRKYEARKRTPIRGSYRGHEILSMAPPTSGGVVLIEMLNILEGSDLRKSGYGSAETVHLIVESMRRAYADRAQYLGDPDFNPQMPVDRLISKEYAAQLRKTINPQRASVSSPTSFAWPVEGQDTTHLSVVDGDRNAVALTYTLEAGYGSKIVVPGGGFLLNNEMGDFNAGPGLTSSDGLIGTPPNLAAPGKRMLSSMTPTIVAKDGRVLMVTGSPGSRTIPNTVLTTILNVIDFGMNAQESVDAPRIHHQWLPNRITIEPRALSPDTIALLRAKGHDVREGTEQGEAEVIVYSADHDLLEAGVDRRRSDGGIGIQ